jgi:hypothetical protein
MIEVAMSARRFVVLLGLFILVSTTAHAQKIVYVRMQGNDASDGLSESAANGTIEGALVDAEPGDIVDVGPGLFEGADVRFSVSIRGANSGADITRWGEPTVIKSPLTLGAGENPVELSCDGVTFRQTVPVNGKSPNAVVSLSNCMFNASKTLSTEGLQWGELVVIGCVFKATMKDVSLVTERALNVNGLSVAYLAESSYLGYSKEAIRIASIDRLLKVQYNEITDCNTSATSGSAGLVADLSGLDNEVEIQKNLITNCKNGIQISGNVSGRPISVQFNKIVRIPTGFQAIIHTGTGQLQATCNAVVLPETELKKDRAAQIDAYSKLFSGPIDVFPLNDKAEDEDGSAIGFEPNPKQCTFTK